MLVNSFRLDLFETSILRPVHDHTQENSNRIGEMNLQLGNALCTVLAPTSVSGDTTCAKLSLVKDSNSKTNTNSSSSQSKSPYCKKQANRAIQSTSQSPSQSQSRSEDSTISICPVCESKIKKSGLNMLRHVSCANVDPDNTEE